MSLRNVIVRLLLRIYPKAWRDEYGQELENLLLARALSVAIVVDVLVSGAGERVRGTGVAVLSGLAMLALMTVAVAANMAGFDGVTVLQASEKTLPTVIVKPFGSELYVLGRAACGWWTVARRGGTVARAGAAAARVTAFAGVPVMVVGALLWLGLLELGAAAPGAALPQSDSALRFVFSGAALNPPSPLAVIVAPLFALPLSWLWGVVGGQLARWTRRGDLQPVS